MLIYMLPSCKNDVINRSPSKEAKDSHIKTTASFSSKEHRSIHISLELPQIQTKCKNNHKVKAQTEAYELRRRPDDKTKRNQLGRPTQ